MAPSLLDMEQSAWPVARTLVGYISGVKIHWDTLATVRNILAITAKTTFGSSDAPSITATSAKKLAAAQTCPAEMLRTRPILSMAATTKTLPSASKDAPSMAAL